MWQTVIHILTVEEANNNCIPVAASVEVCSESFLICGDIGRHKGQVLQHKLSSSDPAKVYYGGGSHTNMLKVAICSYRLQSSMPSILKNEIGSWITRVTDFVQGMTDLADKNVIVIQCHSRTRMMEWAGCIFKCEQKLGCKAPTTLALQSLYSCPLLSGCGTILTWN